MCDAMEITGLEVDMQKYSTPLLRRNSPLPPPPAPSLYNALLGVTNEVVCVWDGNLLVLKICNANKIMLYFGPLFMIALLVNTE